MTSLRAFALVNSVYTNNLLKKFGMQDCKAVGTPVDVNTKPVIATNDDESVYQ